VSDNRQIDRPSVWSAKKTVNNVVPVHLWEHMYFLVAEKFAKNVFFAITTIIFIIIDDLLVLNLCKVNKWENFNRY